LVSSSGAIDFAPFVDCENARVLRSEAAALGARVLRSGKNERILASK
jgi:hypothetical protein